MSLLQIFMMILVVSVFINGLLYLLYKDKEKVDKGFTFVYFGLSSRRKFIRSLWSLPIIILSLIVIYRSSDIEFYEKLIMVITFFVFLLELIFNYYKWKKYGNNERVKKETL